ncbi:hypothetical protein MYE70_06655 [Marinobacter alexandrii]|uniref:hypothetical protein n=1 Tax=Marinobacter alexandrii TaxID=2570351 RepID=UPI001FFF9AE3|nr:hypothetical protein [Marinobacter alexandrii]MCK2148745.1 hypothetical protein [Marinobacter alexandrii]
MYDEKINIEDRKNIPKWVIKHLGEGGELYISLFRAAYKNKRRELFEKLISDEDTAHLAEVLKVNKNGDVFATFKSEKHKTMAMLK